AARASINGDQLALSLRRETRTGEIDLVERTALPWRLARPGVPRLPGAAGTPQRPRVNPHSVSLGIDLEEVVEPGDRLWPIPGRRAERSGSDHVQLACGMQVAEQISAVLVDVAVQAQTDPRAADRLDEGIVDDLLVARDRVMPHGDPE